MMDEDIGFGQTEFKGCPKCKFTGFVMEKDTDVALPCECWRKEYLLSRIKKANIPSEYWHCTLDQLESDVYANIVDFSKYTNEDKQTDIFKIDLHRFLRDFIVKLYAVRQNGESLFMFGGNGVGKTMVSAIVLKNAVWYSLVSLGRVPDYSGYFITFKEYIDMFFRDKDKDVADLIEYIRNVDFLVLDEVGAEPRRKDVDKPSDFFRSLLDDLLRHRGKWKLPTMITTNLTESEFKYQYKSDASSAINRIWSIIEGGYTVLEVKKEGGSYRRIHRNSNTKNIVDKYAVDKKSIISKGAKKAK